jgi:hypothetical protein
MAEPALCPGGDRSLKKNQNGQGNHEWRTPKRSDRHYKSLLVSRQDLFAKQDLLLYGFFAQSNWCWLSCSRTIDHVDIAFRPFQN